MKTFRISYVYEGETAEFSKLYSARSRRDAESKFKLDLIDASEDCPEKATITHVDQLSA